MTYHFSSVIYTDFLRIYTYLLGEIGVSPGEGTGATMSEDEDEQVESDAHLFDGNLDGLGFGPLVPTESERSLMERVRQELKHELKQVATYRLIC